MTDVVERTVSRFLDIRNLVKARIIRSEQGKVGDVDVEVRLNKDGLVRKWSVSCRATEPVETIDGLGPLHIETSRRFFRYEYAAHYLTSLLAKYEFPSWKKFKGLNTSEP